MVPIIILCRNKRQCLKKYARKWHKHVIDKNTTWNGGIVGVNSFGFGGTNSHAILSSHTKLKTKIRKSKIPRLVTVSGTSEDAVGYFLDNIKKAPYDEELYGLIDSIHKKHIIGHEYRGFCLVDDTKSNEIKQIVEKKRPIWYIFSGMGSQCANIGKVMMDIEPFRKSIEQSASILKTVGVDLKTILVNEKLLDNILNSFVTITSIQIALVDTLEALGIEPEGIIGHSLGEVACGYAEASITLEQCILISYYRGKIFLESKAQNGAMAAVGLSWDECKQLLPNNVDIACNNSADNVTISGPSESVHKFIQFLSEKGIFAKAVNSSGFAFHSKYIQFAGSKLKADLDKLIPNKNLRTSKWISTSIPKSDWGVKGKFSDSEYYVNNLLSPVYFYEATQMIPEDAVVLEISPHCLLQSILKRSLPKSVSNIGLLKNDSADDVNFFLSSVGRIYSSGCDVNIAAIYPPIEFPVSKGTPIISNMIKWNHTVEWGVPDFLKNTGSSELAFEIDLNKEEYAFLEGHVIDGKLLFPGSGYMWLAWRAFANLRNKHFEQVPVIFEDVEFLRTTPINKTHTTRFLVNILNFSGEFEISENNEIVAKGKINPMKEFPNLETELKDNDDTTLSLNKTDIYKYLRLKGFENQGMFQGLNSCDQLLTKGKISWEGNWVTFIDCMLQFYIIVQDVEGLQLPTGIKKVIIDPKAHGNTNEIWITGNKEIGAVKSGGIELSGLKGSTIAKRKQAGPNIEKYIFVPFINDKIDELDNILAVVAQIVAENSSGAAFLKIAEVVGDNSSEFHMLPKIGTVLEREPHHGMEGIVVSENINLHHDSYQIKETLNEEVHLLIYSDALINKKLDEIQNTATQLKPGGFILFEESSKYFKTNLLPNDLQIIYKQVTSDKTYILTRKVNKRSTADASIVIEIKENNYDWIALLKKAMDLSETNGCKIYLATHDEYTGILGLITCLRREPGSTNIRTFFIQDKKAERFSLQSNFYKAIIEKDLAQNVLKNNTWGNYRHLLLNPEVRKEVEYAHIEGNEWVEGKTHQNNMCDVYFGSLDNNDILLANGRKSDDFCSEFSGRDCKGKRVMGLIKRRGLASKISSDKTYLWDVPDKWSLQEASTIPMAYAISYYALVIRGQLETEESVLINNGCDPIGLASISIALKMSCKIYTMANNNFERDLLKKQFTQLTNENILSANSFEKELMMKTKGHGVDVVLNQLKGEQFLSSVSCLAHGGRFLEIGNNTPQDNSIASKNASFHSVSMEGLFTLKAMNKSKIAHLISKGVQNGEIRPLPSKVFDAYNLGEAFKNLQNIDGAQKVLLKIQDEEIRTLKPKPIKAIARSYMNSDKVYIIIGGLGGFGVELTNWLITRGAKKIILCSRNGVSNGYQSFCIKRWSDQGVYVQISTIDVADIKQAKDLFNQANSVGQVGGIFNVAAVIRDTMFMNQNESDFKLVCSPKLTITKNLDLLSRSLTPNLDYFVCFSSASGGRGNIGQGSYGFANSAMERICEKRSSDGLPALAIQWGQIGDVGMVADHLPFTKTEIVASSAQKLTSCLATLDAFMQQSEPIVGSIIVAEKRKKTAKSGGQTSLTNAVAEILGISLAKASAGNALSDLGMDSIMSVEIKQMMEKDFQLDVTIKEITKLTFGDLEKLEARKGMIGADAKSKTSKIVRNEAIKQNGELVASS